MDLRKEAYNFFFDACVKEKLMVNFSSSTTHIDEVFRQFFYDLEQK
jgi:hypothetical protein